jgi:uncharacterized protein
MDPTVVGAARPVRACLRVRSTGAACILAGLLAAGCKSTRGDASDSPTAELEPTVTAPKVVPVDAPESSPVPEAETTTLASAKPPVEDAELDGHATVETAAEPVAEPPKAPREGPYRVLILGDSLAATGFGALLERKLDAHEDIVCYRKGKSASGLARPDFFDWITEGKRQVELRKPDLVVVVMGGNDGQDLTKRVAGEQRVPWKHADWDARYRARTDEFLAEIAGNDRKILWLGLPTMGLRSLEKKLVTIRQIQREAVEALGERGVYLDTAPFVADEEGGMLSHAEVGPKRKPQKIRADDRIHFTMSGSEYFADQIYPSVLQVLDLEEENEDRSETE